MIVMKFGGTSTQDAAAMKNVAQIVKSRLSLHPFVVISAIAKGTNALERAGKLGAARKRDEAHAVLKELIDRHTAIVDENITDAARKQELHTIIEHSHRELEELVHGVSILRELTPRTLDAFYCYGELLSSRLVAATIAQAGMKARWIDTKDFLVTDNNFTAAAPMMETVSQKLAQLTAGQDEDAVFVTQGFIGVTEDGYRTTMGRESSDYSAAVIGAALGAKDVQIWTDVDGILTADPAVVSSPRKVTKMSFHEAYDLSFFGAKVLHPNTMIPAFEKNIPIHIFNSRRPQLSGSQISSEPSGDDPQVKSVTGMGGVAMLQVTPLTRISQYIFWEQLFSILTKHRANSKLVSTSEYNIAISLEEKHSLAAIVNDLEEIGAVQVHRGLGIVSLVGANLRQDLSLLRRVFGAIGTIPVLMISSGASGCNFSFLVSQDSIRQAVIALHREFFEGELPAEVFEELKPAPASR